EKLLLTVVFGFKKEGNLSPAQRTSQSTVDQEPVEVYGLRTNYEMKRQRIGFTFEMDEVLIDNIRQHPEIYDTCHRKYSDNFHKTSIWRQIGEKNEYWFPPDVERAKYWLTACDRPDLLDKVNTLYKSHRICDAHFPPLMFRNGKRKLLRKDAVPIHFSSMGEIVPSTSGLRTTSSNSQTSHQPSILYQLLEPASNTRSSSDKAESPQELTPYTQTEQKLREINMTLQLENDALKGENQALRNLQQCKQRWESIRAQYRKTLRLRKTRTGQSASEVKWKYEDLLEFLHPHMKMIDHAPFPQENVSYTGSEDDIDEQTDTEPCGSRILDSPYPPPTVSTQPEGRDELDLFFETMKETVRKFSPGDRYSAKQQIFTLVSKIEGKYVYPQPGEDFQPSGNERRRTFFAAGRSALVTEQQEIV
ncbi:hypothetical protein NQ317_009382, partial [Molorchus minor]